MMIDASQISCFLGCPRMYRNKMLLCLAKRRYDETAVDANFGKCIHSGLEVYYQTKDIEKGIEKFVSLYQDLDGELCKTKANGITLLREYHRQYGEQDKEWKILAVEVVDKVIIEAVPLQYNEVEYIVKIDTIIEDRGNIYVVDHKTTSSKYKNYYFARYDPNTQVSGYCNYVQEKYGQCSGMIINGLFVGHRQRAYKGEPAGFHCDFERAIINRYPQQLADFKSNVRAVTTMIEWCKANNVWAKNEHRCHDFKGCEYKELCLACDDNEVKEGLYETCDPYEYLKKGDDNV